MPKSRQLSLIEARGYEPTPENVKALTDEIWRLQELLAQSKQKAARAMRNAAVAVYEEICQRDRFTDAEVVKALHAIPLLTD